MTGLQQAITSIRVNSKDITKKPDTKHCNILTVAEQDNVPTIYRDSDLRKYGGTSDSTGGQTFDSGSAQSPQRSKNSTDNSSKQTSVQCPKCDVMMEKAQKMIDTKGTKIAAIDAMIDLANTCYAACRGESSDSMYQRKIERKLDNIEHDLQFKH